MPNENPRSVTRDNWASKYTANRRVVFEFGAYVAAHLKEPLRTNAEPFGLRQIINDVMKAWIDNDYRCIDPMCTYCREHRPSADFRRRFRDKLGGKSEREGFRRKDM